jgi:hypothetical protein
VKKKKLEVTKENFFELLCQGVDEAIKHARQVPPSDPINKPEHYNKTAVEPIDVIEAWDLPFHLGNVIKYIARHKHKGTAEQDLKKAAWYLDRYINRRKHEK